MEQLQCGELPMLGGPLVARLRRCLGAIEVVSLRRGGCTYRRSEVETLCLARSEIGTISVTEVRKAHCAERTDSFSLVLQ